MTTVQFDDALFETRRDPETGVEHHLLARTRPTRGFAAGAPFVTRDGRHLWTVLGTDAPVFARVDAAAGTLERVAPAAPDAAPALDVRSGETTLASGRFAYRTAPDEALTRLGALAAPGEGLRAGLTRSAGGDRVLAVVGDGESWRVVSRYRPTGETDTWHSGSRRYDRVLCSPTDPTVAFLVGDRGTWLAREGLGARPVERLLPRDHRAHWWRPDGGGLWYVEPGVGVGQLDLEVGRHRTVWRIGADRAHATADGEVLAAADGERVVVHDPEAETTATVTRGLGGVAARPQFVARDRYLAYTTGAPGRPTLAVTPVAPLREAL